MGCSGNVTALLAEMQLAFISKARALTVKYGEIRVNFNRMMGVLAATFPKNAYSSEIPLTKLAGSLPSRGRFEHRDGRSRVGKVIRISHCWA